MHTAATPLIGMALALLPFHSASSIFVATSALFSGAVVLRLCLC